MLTSLPEELLDHIINFLDTGAPSLAADAQHPQRTLLSGAQHVKSLSLVNHVLRRITSKILFANLRLNVSPLSTAQLRISVQQPSLDVQNPLAIIDPASITQQLSTSVVAFQSFVAAQNLTHADSLLVYSTSEADLPQHATDEHPLHCARPLAAFWAGVLSVIEVEKLVLVAPPQTLAVLAQIRIDYGDRWAFDIPFQRLVLSPHFQGARSIGAKTVAGESAGGRAQESSAQGAERRSIIASTSTLVPTSTSPLFTPPSAPHTTTTSPNATKIKWKSLSYDEGSSLNLYGHVTHVRAPFFRTPLTNTRSIKPQYHYQDKQSPSLLTSCDPRLEHALSHLHSLTYTSIFPHYESFIKFIDLLHYCRALETLRLTLAPDPRNSTILDDTERIGRGSTSFRDCWQEVDRCLGAVGGFLQTVVLHAANETVGAEGESGGDEGGEESGGQGREEAESFQYRFALRRVEIVDCRIESVREDVERVFGGLVGWRGAGGGIWVRDKFD